MSWWDCWVFHIIAGGGTQPMVTTISKGTARFELLNKHLHVQYMLQFPIIMCSMLQSLMPRFGYSMESNLLLFFLQKSPLAEESRAHGLHTATETLEVNLTERPGLCQIFSLAT